LFKSFTIYTALEIIKGKEALYNSSTEVTSTNFGVIFDIGAKIELSDNVTLDASIEITGGNRHKPKEIDEPTAFSISLFYNFD
jgi:hypothetical protein